MEERKEYQSNETKISNEEFEKYNTIVNRLKWILEHCMGAKNAFEYRKEELFILTGKKHSDDEVAENFFNESENGCFKKYLELGTITCRIGNTLFIHGAIHNRNMGFIPSLQAKHTYHGATVKEGAQELLNEPIELWINEFDKFKQISLQCWQDFLKNPFLDCTDSKFHRPGEALLSYGFNDATNFRSCMVDNFFDSSRKVQFPENETTLYLSKNNIFRIIVGHKPIGELPLVIKHPNCNLEIICADISYSGINKRSDSAIYDLTINGTENYNYCHLRGNLHNNDFYEFSLHAIGFGEIDNLNLSPSGDDLIGKRTQNGAWIQAIIPTQNDSETKYLLTKFEGRKTLSFVLCTEEVLQLLK